MITFQIVSFLIFSFIIFYFTTILLYLSDMYESRRLRIQQQYFRQQLIVKGLIFLTGLIVVGFIFSFLLFAWYARDLPSPTKLSQAPTASTVFYDRDGNILYEMYKDKNRMPVAFADLPTYLKQATISIEDKNFYHHGGVSEMGIIRSVIDLIIKHRLEGGSTITQQLIKNVLLNSNRSISRKIKEAILAFEAEKKYTKDEILTMYLNEAPYGGTIWGVGSAAMTYFGKPVKDLNLVECAILAGLPQDPSYYSPYIGKNDAWKGRAQDVLRRMREDGYITDKQEKKADADVEAYGFAPPKMAINAPHFVFYVKDLVDKDYGPQLIEQGVKIKTTLSLPVEQTVEKIVKDEIEKLKGYNATNAAVVVLDSQTGEILAMDGSYDYNDPKFGKFNAALGLRQPGSAVKPITYSLAFEKGYTPATVLMDVKTDFPDQGGKNYSPVNYDGKFRGPVQLRFALGNSINIPAVKLLAMVGIKNFLQRAYDMGLTQLAPTQDNLNRFGLSVTLGGGETTLLDLTSAYEVFADGGVKKQPSSILDISDFKGNTIYKQVKMDEKRITSPEVAFLISHILSDNNARMAEFGPNSYLNIPGKTVAVKTGTTDDKRDNWTVGYTNSITVGVWVGNNDNSPMNPKIASGITGASPIWYDIMRELLKKYDDGIIAKPNDVKAVTIDSYLGGLPKDNQPTRTEYFIVGTEPKTISPFYKTLKIARADGKLANDVQIKRGDYDQKDCIVITEDDPVSTDGINRWQQAINDWAKNQPDDRLKCPTDTSSASSDSVIVQIKSPGDQAMVGTGNVDVQAKVYSVVDIKNVKIYLNDNQVQSIDGNNRDIDQNVSIGSDGVYRIKVAATNNNGQTGDSTINLYVGVTPTPTPTPTSP